MRRAKNPVGLIIREHLKSEKINQAELARRMQVSRPRVTKLIHGTARIGPVTAERLAKGFTDTDASFWLAISYYVRK